MNGRPSRPRVVALASLLGLLGLTGALSGCGAEDEQMEARYPQGGTAPAEDEPRPTSEARASLEGIPPRDPNDIAIGVDDADEGYAESDPSTLTTFKPALENYGTWEDDGTYGTVWYPSRTVVGNDFAPYVTAGHWVYEDDYVWVSDYDWGWAPFHYGRWVYVAGRGWAWIPGRRYAGAWVAWRTGYDGYGYVGWAPLPPTWYWRGGYAYGLYAVPPAPYVFCASHDVFAPAVAQRVVVGPQVPVIAANTRPYVPAAPSVGNGGNSGRVPASPGVGGPPPGRLGFNADTVPHAPRGNVGLLRAQGASRPPRGVGALEGGRGLEGASLSAGAGAGRARAPIASGTRTLGSGSGGETVYSGTPAPRLPTQSFSTPQGGTPPTFSSSYPSSSAGRASPTYGGSQSFPSSAPYRSSPTFGGSSGSGSSGSSYSGSPSYSRPASGSGGSGGSHFGGGGSGGSYSGSSSSPSRSSSPSPSFRSAPSGGGASPARSTPSHSGGFSRPRR